MPNRVHYAIVELWPGEPSFHSLSGRHEFFTHSLVSRTLGDDLTGLREPVGLILFHHTGIIPPNLASLTVQVDRQDGHSQVLRGSLPMAPVIVLAESPDPQLTARYMQLGALDVLPPDGPVEVLAARAAQALRDLESRENQARELGRVHRSRRLAEGMIDSLVPIAVALTAETDMDRLVERILSDVMDLCGAEGGTLYLRSENNNLGFRLVRNRVLGIHMGGADGDPIQFPPLPLHDPKTDSPNERYVSCAAAVWGRVINIRDVYSETRFDFKQTRVFDEANGYTTRSMIALPLRNTQERVIGVLQLINARDLESGEPTVFDADHERWLIAMAMIATSALETCARMHTLQEKIKHLDLDVDPGKRDTQVKQITESDSFRSLKDTALRLRAARARAQIGTPSP